MSKESFIQALRNGTSASIAIDIHLSDESMTPYQIKELIKKEFPEYYKETNSE